MASQRGEPRPPFATRTGRPIFPDDDDPWWLTELSRRVREEGGAPPPGDEDGPPSDEEGPADDELTEDEDPLSHGGGMGPPAPDDEPSAVWPVCQDPFVFWGFSGPLVLIACVLQRVWAFCRACRINA